MVQRGIRVGLSLAVTIGAAACGSPRPRVDVCGRGDRTELAAALRGGSLEIAFVDKGGVVLVQIDAAVDRLTDLARSIPDGTAAVEVTGRTDGGEPVAIGRSPVDGNGACVCLALTAQHAAACEAIGCRVEGETCAFLDADGQPAGARTLTLGDNPDDTIVGVVRDTFLSSDAALRDTTFGGESALLVASEPIATTLVHIDVSALPRSSEIVSAVLELTPCGDCTATGTLAAFPVLEDWSEGAEAEESCATWNCRQDALAWAVPGCGYLSEIDRSRLASAVAIAEVAGPGEAVLLDVTGQVVEWIASPETNRGLALAVDELGVVELNSREASGARPRLRVEYRLPDDVAPPDGGLDGPPDAEPDVDTLPEMVTVPAGVFIMGCDSRVATCETNEQPAHAVSLSAFEIDTTEVTQEAFAVCVEAGDCLAPSCEWDPVARARYPVTCVNHAQAQIYCASVGKRLPTEAEWEKAARGTGAASWPWGDDPPTCSLANKFGCVGTTQSVGLRPDGESPYGARDMAGNAAEWVADFFAENYYATSPAADPPGPATGTRRVRRGGAYPALDESIQVFERANNPPSDERPNIGLRCARSL